MSRLKALLLFTNTRGVIKAETFCRTRNLPVAVVAVPRHLSSECGMCLSIPAPHAAEVITQLRAAGVSCTGPHPPTPPPAFDLLQTVETGGCSAKLPADLLAQALQDLVPDAADANLLVGVDTLDDAAVYRLSPEQALIVTTDFFPPICGDAFTFGKIAAANALSDVYAMGGKVLLAMNLVMFPATGIPFTVLQAILAGSAEKVREAGGLTVGGHTIADTPPKFGLAVVGLVHPERVMTNALGRPGDLLILTKPLGTGTLVAGQRIGEADQAHYQRALTCMQQLNRVTAEVASRFGVRCATDITGFGLLGHLLHIAKSSNLQATIWTDSLPVLPGAIELLDRGCIPGAAFRNQNYVSADTTIAANVTYAQQMLCLDPQTSGGLLFSIAAEQAESCVNALHDAGVGDATVVGCLQPLPTAPDNSASQAAKHLLLSRK